MTINQAVSALLGFKLEWLTYNERPTLVSSDAFFDKLKASKEAPEPAAPPAVDPMEEVYRKHYTLLLYISCRKFRVPPGDAENLIQEVFLSFLSTAKEIHDVRSWLVGSISNASRQYWRSRGRTEPLPDDLEQREEFISSGLAETVALRITIRETMSRLHSKCREALRLHYFEGWSAPEMARQFSTSNRSAEKLIHKCLKRAHAIYQNLTAGKP
ncbi:MAG: sigma-70 family RNA polymerase sigma factor [Acidobacteriota bacterium]